jgi:hypothetical protein
MNSEWVLFHLREAEEELRRTIARLESTPDYDRGEFGVAMAHVYHHLNTAWNSQNETESAAHECAKDDFFRWRQFPTDIYLGP